MKSRRLLVPGVAWALGGATTVAAPLPALTLERAQTTVSGLSSGGDMATQLHLAWSSVFGPAPGLVVAEHEPARIAARAFRRRALLMSTQGRPECKFPSGGPAEGRSGPA